MNVVLAILGVETFVYLKDKEDRWTAYYKAEKLAKEMKKELLVVGGPNPTGSNATFYLVTGKNAHGYGDCCVDIREDACTGAPRVVVADVRNMPFSDREFGVVFCSHVLELLPNIEECRKAEKELRRVADRVIVNSLTRWFIPYYANPQIRQFVEQLPDGSIRFTEK